MRILLIFLFVAFSACENIAQSDSSFERISIQEAKNLIAENTELIIVDVRTDREVAAGKIENAIHINYFDPNFKEMIQKIDKSSKVLVYCAVGGRSAKAAQDMKKMGFESVYDLKEGYNVWKQQK